MVVLPPEDGMMELRFTIYDLRASEGPKSRPFSTPRFPSPRPSPSGRGRMLHCRSTKLSGVSGRPTFRMHDTAAACPLFPVGAVQGGTGLLLNTPTRSVLAASNFARRPVKPGLSCSRE